MINILIVGSGAREHAIATALSKSENKPKIYCFGTTRNPGIQRLTSDYRVGDITDPEQVNQQAKEWEVNLAIIGPEAPLEHAVADALWDCGIPVIGPRKNLAKIETSKAFARELMEKYGIPGLPKYKVFTSIEGIREFLSELGENNYVVKANGLMAGKGVRVGGEHLLSFEEALNYCKEIFDHNQSLVIEEKLIGQEFSFMCFSDGISLIPMPIVQDHKRAYENDEGPNTGGMGSYSAADHSLPFLSPEDVRTAFEINQSVINALMTEMSDKYIGILYGGFMATAHGVYVIEFNARFGDPEALNVLSLLESDFVRLCIAMANGNLQKESVRFLNQATVCKYAVPDGYPDNPLRHVEIDISAVEPKDTLFLAAVNFKDGKLYATGSRTAAYVGIANTISEAEEIAEQQIKNIKGPLFHRKDIGTSPLINTRVEVMRRLRAS
ncbi:Phosphoribosylamine--glycine ligase [Legionella pneumophila]|uniref:phosphoribosylamine--glycine ligase n=1 Tax=Legionella pneumophila TaxID=446 RepID=UPI00026D9B84|nr:phosphoribosylamine--glycine ligase [Legionella pneumophila]MCK1859231.1 phosphoribosylamine--glycine ligase [Legionella pneumophila]MDW9140023.1 phosphoribosylamine--glycine ligase [Legionella pneumophila]CCD09060.1 Phosphoribosylamine-glycine ligase [Legionella pneumophila subsp. pneumophila]CZI65529.1 Phosphoribosylamine--glycine ligase [Legionella pneumophila]CZQ81390.1 Phosphoribosylamine--glycine ligase [Legionella pneumophila]